MGCGADEEPAQPARDTSSTTPQQTETGEARSSPEDEQGGAGDEEPIGSEVRIEGNAGRLRPRRVRVSPFIAVRLELRSKDGSRYRASVAGRTLTAEPDRPARITLDGLMPDRSYRLRGLDRANDVRIVASGEPGG